MAPQPGQTVFNFSTLPEDLQRALTFLDIKPGYFTSQQLLAELMDKFPHLVALFVTIINDQLLAQNADHLLVQVKQLFDFSALERYRPRDFTLSDDDSTLTCPNGVSSTRAYRCGSADGVYFRFTEKDCAGCPIFTKCRQMKKDQEPRIKGHRSAFISDYRDHAAEARAYSSPFQFAEEIKKRPIIERHIAGLVRYNGAREAVFIGTRKVDFQMKMAATCFNLKRWVARLAEANKSTRKKEKKDVLSFGSLKYKLPKPMPVQA